MLRKPAAFLAALGAILLPACDAFNLRELKPGVTTALEVRDRMGPPEMEWQESDGSVTWEYPRTPEGTDNYMIVIGPDRILREVRQVLTEDNFARVQPGMTREQVRRLLGKPAHQTWYALRKEWVWDWKMKREVSTEWFFDVHFDEEGRVLRTGSHPALSG